MYIVNFIRQKYQNMTRSRKDHDVVGQFGKGSLVLVTWPVDGHPYEAKVVDVKGDSV